MSPRCHALLLGLLVFSACAAILLLACDPVGQDPPQRDQPERQATKSAEQHAGAREDHEDHHHHEEGQSCSNCGGGSAEVEPAGDGPLLTEQSVGDPISDDVELVNAADIVANPEQFAGRTIRIQGRVKGFCHHRRAWFAIDVPTATPPYLRVVTAPNFLVPGGIMNASATTVGTVEVTEVPGSRRTHYEREHALGSGGNEPGRARRAIIRATGATFAPAS